jgi:hypothetical protein
MNAFWAIGIGVNLVAFAALVWWAVKNWRRGGVARPPGERDDGR